MAEVPEEMRCFVSVIFFSSILMDGRITPLSGAPSWHSAVRGTRVLQRADRLSTKQYVTYVCSEEFSCPNLEGPVYVFLVQTRMFS